MIAPTPSFEVRLVGATIGRPLMRKPVLYEESIKRFLMVYLR